jgi:putative flavoprotein involved in K+ transport
MQVEMTENRSFDVIVIGGGQSGLAVGYFLRRSGLSYVILDAEERGGGAWQHMWNSLRLFSPAQWSSLPGVIMSGGPDYYPTRSETIDYLIKYEERYKLPVRRPVKVHLVSRIEDTFHLETSDGLYESRAVVAATGIFNKPFYPEIPGLNDFQGDVLHAGQYVSPAQFAGKRVAVVGEGNSGAQILAEISQVADTVWVTLKNPTFLPDHVDGRYLFDAASQMYEAKRQGKDYTPPSLGQIVMVEPVREAFARGVFNSPRRAFSGVTKNSLIWSTGGDEKVDAIVFCTGFRPSLDFLKPLEVIKPDGRVSTIETRATRLPGLWLVGYGNWTGFASATLIGVGRSARATVDQVIQYTSQGISAVGDQVVAEVRSIE